MADDVRGLYKSLQEVGYTREELGSEDSFVQSMSDETERRNIYNGVSKRGNFDLGSYEDYERKYGGSGEPRELQLNSKWLSGEPGKSFTMPGTERTAKPQPQETTQSAQTQETQPQQEVQEKPVDNKNFYDQAIKDGAQKYEAQQGQQKSEKGDDSSLWDDVKDIGKEALDNINVALGGVPREVKERYPKGATIIFKDTNGKFVQGRIKTATRGGKEVVLRLDGADSDIIYDTDYLDHNTSMVDTKREIDKEKEDTERYEAWKNGDKKLRDDWAAGRYSPSEKEAIEAYRKEQGIFGGTATNKQILDDFYTKKKEEEEKANYDAIPTGVSADEQGEFVDKWNNFVEESARLNEDIAKAKGKNEEGERDLLHPNWDELGNKEGFLDKDTWAIRNEERKREDELLKQREQFTRQMLKGQEVWKKEAYARQMMSNDKLEWGQERFDEPIEIEQDGKKVYLTSGGYTTDDKAVAQLATTQYNDAVAELEAQTKSTKEQVGDLQERVDDMTKLLPEMGGWSPMTGQPITESAREYDRKLKEYNDAVSEWNKSGKEDGTGQGLDEWLDNKGIDKRMFGKNINAPAIYAAKRKLGQLQNFIRIAEKYKDDDIGFIHAFGYGVQDAITDAGTWDFGFSDLSGALAAYDILKKTEAGKKLKPEEEALLDAYALEYAARMEYAQYIGRGYGAGEQAVGFGVLAAQLAISPLRGAGAGAEKAFANWLEKKGINYMERTAAGYAKRFATRAVTSTLPAAGLSLLQTPEWIASGIEGAMDIQANGGEALPEQVGTEAGTYFNNEGRRQQIKGGIARSDKSMAQSIGQSYKSQLIGNWAMMMVPATGEVTGAIGKGLVSSAEKATPKVVADYISKVGTNEAVRGFDSFLKAVDIPKRSFDFYASMQLGNIIDAATPGGQELHNEEGTGVFDLDRQVDEYVNALMFETAMGAARGVSYGWGRYQLGRQFDAQYQNMEAGTWRGKKAQLAELTKKFESGDEQQTADAIKSLFADRSLTKEQIEDAVKLGGLSTQRHFCERMFNETYADLRANENATGRRIQQGLESNFNEGLGIVNPNLRIDKDGNVTEVTGDEAVPVTRNSAAAQEAWGKYNIHRQEVLDMCGKDVLAQLDENPQWTLRTMRNTGVDAVTLQACEEYVNAKAKVDGIGSALGQEARVSAIDAAQAIRGRAQKDGKLHHATLEDGRKVDILSETGTSATIIDENGNTSMVPIAEIASLDGTEGANELIEQGRQRIYKKYQDIRQQLYNPRLQFQPGDTYNIELPNGRRGNVIVIGEMNEKGETTQAGNVFVMMPDSSVEELSMDYIQQQWDMARSEDWASEINERRRRQIEQENAGEIPDQWKPKENEPTGPTEPTEPAETENPTTEEPAEAEGEAGGTEGGEAEGGETATEAEGGTETPAEQPEQRVYEQGDEVQIVDDNGNVVTTTVSGVDGEGKLRVQTDTTVGGKRVSYYTQEQLNELERKAKEAQQPAQQPAETPGEQPAQQPAQQPQQQSALEQLPKTENDKPDFNKAQNASQLVDAMTEYMGGDKEQAKGVINDTLDAAKDALKEAQKTLEDIKNNKRKKGEKKSLDPLENAERRREAQEAVGEAQQMVEYWQDAADEVTRREEAEKQAVIDQLNAEQAQLAEQAEAQEESAPAATETPAEESGTPPAEEVPAEEPVATETPSEETPATPQAPQTIETPANEAAAENSAQATRLEKTQKIFKDHSEFAEMEGQAQAVANSLAEDLGGSNVKVKYTDHPDLHLGRFAITMELPNNQKLFLNLDVSTKYGELNESSRLIYSRAKKTNWKRFQGNMKYGDLLEDLRKTYDNKIKKEGYSAIQPDGPTEEEQKWTPMIGKKFIDPRLGEIAITGIEGDSLWYEANGERYVVEASEASKRLDDGYWKPAEENENPQATPTANNGSNKGAGSVGTGQELKELANKRVSDKKVPAEKAEKIDFKKFVPEDDSRLALSGVYYKDGYAYATSGVVGIKVRMDYPKEYEGKLINPKTGEEVDAKPVSFDKAFDDIIEKGTPVRVDKGSVQQAQKAIAELPKGRQRKEYPLKYIGVAFDSGEGKATSGAGHKSIYINTKYLDAISNVLENSENAEIYANGGGLIVIADGVKSIVLPLSDIGRARGTYNDFSALIKDGQLYIDREGIGDIDRMINRIQAEINSGVSDGVTKAMREKEESAHRWLSRIDRSRDGLVEKFGEQVGITDEEAKDAKKILEKMASQGEGKLSAEVMDEVKSALEETNRAEEIIRKNEETRERAKQRKLAEIEQWEKLKESTGSLEEFKEQDELGNSTEPPHTRTTTQEKKAKERRQSVEGEVKKMTDALGTTVRILDSIDQVRDPKIRKAIEAGEKTGEKVTGWYDPVTGEVVVYYPNLTDVNEAKLTYLHEVVGHKGLRALFGDRFEDTMKDVYRSLPKKLQESIQKRMDNDTFKAQGYSNPLVASIEEELSNWAEKNKKPSWWGRVVANIRDMIRSVVDLEMTDSDIDYLLWRSRNNLEEQTLQKRATDRVLEQRARKANAEARDSQAKVQFRTREEEPINDKIAEAERNTDTEPTDKQKESGNYKKGKVKVAGYDITIENPRGSTRSGTDANGKRWEQEMHNTYGYIRGTEGTDGDHIDVFLAPDMDAWDGKNVYVVDQYNPDGTFDEHKVMLGFDNTQDAKQAYLDNYENGWENGRRIDVSEVSKDNFDKWIDSSHRKTKAFADYGNTDAETLPSATEQERKQNAHERAQQISDEAEKRITDKDRALEQRRINSLAQELGMSGYELPENADLDNTEGMVVREAARQGTLKGSLGERWDEFLKKVYQNTDEETLKDINEYARQNGWNFAEATERYLASLSDNGAFEQAVERGMWDNIKSAFNGALEGRRFEFGAEDNDIRYALWRNEQNKSESPNSTLLARATDTAMHDQLGNGGNGDGDIHSAPVLFRHGDNEVARAADDYEKKIASSLYQLKEARNDHLQSMLEAMKLITGDKKNFKVEDIPDAENFYTRSINLSSLNETEREDWKRTLINPMYDEVRKLAHNDRERRLLNNYIISKHGLERNEYMAEREARRLFDESKAKDNGIKFNWDEISDGLKQDLINSQRRDYAGLTGLFGLKGEEWQQAEAEARELVDSYETAHDTKPLWNKINSLTGAILKKQLDTGIINKATYDKIRKMYNNYVPLRNFEEDTTDDVYAYLNRQVNTYSDPLKKAQGRTSQADNPFVSLEQMVRDVILHGNRNAEVKVPFLNFTLNHPSDLISVDDLWVKYSKDKNMWEPVFPDFSSARTPQERQATLDAWREDMKKLAKQYPDEYKNASQEINIPYRITDPSALSEHQVIARVNGKDVVLTVNGNPRLAQAVNGQTNPDVNIEGWMGVLHNFSSRMTRFLSAVYTTWEANFMAANYARDIDFANSIAYMKEGADYARKFGENAWKYNAARTISLIEKRRQGKLNMNDKADRYFEEFMKNGGETGYTRRMDAEEIRDNITSKLKTYFDTSKSGVEQARKVAEVAGEFGRGYEMSMRFTAFVTSREAGREVKRSVYDAKEISANFNRKGSGGRFYGKQGQTFVGNAGALLSGFLRDVMPFWNAGVQGLSGLVRAAGSGNGAGFRATAVGLGHMAAGAAAPFIALGMINAWNSAFNRDDDDSYWDIDPYTRRSNFCVRTPKGNWAKYPLSIEMRIPYGLGDIFVSYLSGREDKEDALRDVVEVFSQALPWDVMQGQNEESMSSLGGFAAVALTPGAARPIVDPYVRNTDWKGQKLYRDKTDYNKRQPEWRRAYNNTGPVIKGAAKWLNEATGGDDVTKGWFDINPAALQYTLQQSVPGWRLFNQVGNSVDVLLGNKDFDWSYVPIANRFVSTGGKKAVDKSQSKLWNKNREEGEETSYLLKEYAKRQQDPEYAKKFQDIVNDANRVNKALVVKGANSRISSYYSIINNPNSTDEMKEMAKEAIASTQQLANDMIKSIDNGTFEQKYGKMSPESGMEESAD